MNREPTVFVVDDNSSVLTAVSRLLRSAGMSVVTFASPGEFLRQIHPEATGCVVLDMSMPGLSGLELQKELQARGIGIQIVFLTGQADIASSVKAMKGGAVDFLTKPANDLDLIRAIHAAIEKDGVVRRAHDELKMIRQRLAILTKREREVFEHVVQGQPNKEIAVKLGTVEKTIKVHRARVMEKLQVGSLAEMVRLAIRAGIGASE